MEKSWNISLLNGKALSTKYKESVLGLSLDFHGSDKFTLWPDRLVHIHQNFKFVYKFISQETTLTSVGASYCLNQQVRDYIQMWSSYFHESFYIRFKSQRISELQYYILEHLLSSKVIYSCYKISYGNSIYRHLITDLCFNVFIFGVPKSIRILAGFTGM